MNIVAVPGVGILAVLAVILGVGVAIIPSLCLCDSDKSHSFCHNSLTRLTGSNVEAAEKKLALLTFSRLSVSAIVASIREVKIKIRRCEEKA